MIEIFGIDNKWWRCPACVDAKRIAEEAQVPYKFVQVLEMENDTPKYDIELIKEIKERAGFSSLAIRYPVIFVNNEYVRLNEFRSKLVALGYDAEL